MTALLGTKPEATSRSGAPNIRRGGVGKRVTLCSLVLLLACGDTAIDPPPPSNQAPVAAGSIPGQSMEVGGSVTMSVVPYFRDPDGDALVYEAATSSAAVVTASVSGGNVTLAGVGAGDATVTVTATDPGGASARQSIAVTVAPPGNRAPVVADSVPDQSMNVGDSVTVDLADHFSDPDGDALVYEAATLDPNVVKTSVSGSEVTLVAVAVGTAMVTVAATDPDKLTGQQRVNVVVNPRPNASPVATGSISDYSVEVGRVVRLDVAPYFSDPDGDPLVYDIVSLNPDVVEISAEGSVATMTARAVDGTPVETTVRVVAKDPWDGSVQIIFKFAVVAGTYDIELMFLDGVTAEQKTVFRQAKGFWERAITSALIDIPFEANEEICPEQTGLPVFEKARFVDDLLIVVMVEDIDGAGGIGAQARPCTYRYQGSWPITGMARFDSADVRGLDSATLYDFAVHEFGHVLGFGTMWDTFHALLVDPTVSPGDVKDTHFAGEHAIHAFDDAGGSGYAGAKVPVENSLGAGSDNAHWRESVMGDEVMTPVFAAGGGNPASAVTLASLVDLGYSVDLKAADAYTLPTQAAQSSGAERPAVNVADDVLIGPVALIDHRGRVVRILRPERR